MAGRKRLSLDNLRNGGFLVAVRCSARLPVGRSTQSYIRHLLPRLAGKAGIERRAHAHGLRHAFAVGLVRSGAPLYVVRDALGHASIATTQVYLTRVGAHEAVEAMRNRHWLGHVTERDDAAK